MTRLFDFSLQRQGLEDVRFVVCRNELPPDGDLEAAFFAELADLHRHPSGAPFSDILVRLAETSETLAVIRNPRLVLDADLPRRIMKALESLDGIGDWALAGACGLELNDRHNMALYASACPAIPEYAGLQPVVDVMPDFYLINAGFIRRQSPPLTTSDTALELTLVTQGYLDNHVSVFAPDLAAAIDGDLIPRAFGHLADGTDRAFSDRLGGQTISSLSGPIILSHTDVVEDLSEPQPDLKSTVVQCVTSRADAPKFTIVTRTRFQRLHLLRRMLTSISRARSAEIPFEVVLSTDVESELAESTFEDLQQSFVNLDLRLRLNPPGGHSRVTNLLGGVEAASGDYILILDDDDSLDPLAFDRLLPAFFAGKRPLIALTTECHEETWEETPSSRWVLAHSAPMTSYPSSGWRDMFCGINKLPICGLAIPHARLEARLKTFELRHDLSEDYALFFS